MDVLLSFNVRAQGVHIAHRLTHGSMNRWGFVPCSLGARSSSAWEFDSFCNAVELDAWWVRTKATFICFLTAYWNVPFLMDPVSFIWRPCALCTILSTSASAMAPSSKRSCQPSDANWGQSTNEPTWYLASTVPRTSLEDSISRVSRSQLSIQQAMPGVNEEYRSDPEQMVNFTIGRAAQRDS